MSINRVVSVIIVNFNGGDLLTDCVRSVLASTLPVVVYLVDNDSKDDSLSTLQQAIKNDTRVHIIKNNHNLGFASAVNLAISKTKSDYLLLLNPDCLIRPETLARFVDIMDNNLRVGMAGGLVRNLDGTEQRGCRRQIPTPWRTIVQTFFLDKLFPNNPKFESFVFRGQPLPKKPIEIEGISGACMFVRRKALETVGPMDEYYFLHCEDLDWFMRFHQKQWSILFIPNIEVVHIKGTCSQDRPIRVLWYKHRGIIRFYRKFFQAQYSLLFLRVISLAVWVRFAILVIISLIKPKKNYRNH